jgi:hypothetical protein
MTGDWEGGSARVSDAISQLTTKFDFKVMLSNAKASVGEFFAGLQPVFTEYAPVIAETVAAWTAELWKWVQPAIEPLLIEAGTLMTRVSDKLGEELPPLLIKAMGKATVAFVAWIADNFGPMVKDEIGRQAGIIAEGLLTLNFEKVGESWFASIVTGLAKAAWGFNPLGFVANAGMKASGDLGTAAGNALLDQTMGPVQGPQKPGGNAEGTDFWRGGLTWVGENGPELLDLPTGSSITNHQQSMRTMNDAMQQINLGGINLTVPVSAPGGLQNVTAMQLVQQTIPMLLDQFNAALEQARGQVVTG